MARATHPGWPSRGALAIAMAAVSLGAASRLPAAAPRTSAAKVHRATAKLTPEQRTLHALDRLTFGPRPGEMQVVTRQGLDHWFEQQLHPDRIADDALQARLARYPAM